MRVFKAKDVLTHEAIRDFVSSPSPGDLESMT